jgi:uncharacterized protein (AIM24 family)
MTSTTDTTYHCPYCRQDSAGATGSCAWCGAPVDIALRTTTGGWTEQPPIADMTRLQAGRSTVQIEGTMVPVADWTLAEGDGVYFIHHVLLWQEPSVAVGVMPLSKPYSRLRAGLPLTMLQASGPGHIAFSHDSPGEVIAIPLQPDKSVDVGEHRMLVATKGVGFDWHESGVWYSASGASSAGQGAGMGVLKMGLDLAGHEERDRDGGTEWHYPMGRFLDRFTAGEQPGLVMIHAAGNAYTRDLAEGETMLIKPPALLFKDPSVQVQLHVEYPHAGMRFWRSWGNRYLWLRVWGPGRVGIESCYEADADPGTDFQSMSQATQHSW